MHQLCFRLQTVLKTLFYRPWLNVVMLLTLMVAFFLPMAHLAWGVYAYESSYESEVYRGKAELKASLSAGSSVRIREAFAKERVSLRHLSGMVIRTPLSWEGEVFLAHVIGRDEEKWQAQMPLLEGRYPEHPSTNQPLPEVMVTLDFSQKYHLHIGDCFYIRGQLVKVVGYTALSFYMVPSVVCALSDMESWYEGEMLFYTVYFDNEDMARVQALWSQYFPEELEHSKMTEAEPLAEGQARARAMSRQYHRKEMGMSLALSAVAMVMVYVGYGLQKKKLWGILRTLGATRGQMLGDMAAELFIYAAVAVVLDYIVLSFTDRYLVWMTALHVRPMILWPALGMAFVMAVVTATISWALFATKMPVDLLEE